MQPNEPAEPRDAKRYDFFLNPPPPPKKSKIPIPAVPGTNDPFLKKVILLVGGGVVVIIIVAVLASVIFGGKDNVTSLVKLTQQQNELIRVATEANSGTTSQTVKNLDLSIELSITTSQQQLLAYLKKQGHNVGTKQLALLKSAATDTQLTNATAASNYDNVFTQIMQSQLQTYTQGIQQNYNATSNATLRQLLKTEYAAGTLLLTQANNTATNLQNP